MHRIRHFEEEPAQQFTKDEARRIAANYRQAAGVAAQVERPPDPLSW